MWKVARLNSLLHFAAGCEAVPKTSAAVRLKKTRHQEKINNYISERSGLSFFYYIIDELLSVSKDIILRMLHKSNPSTSWFLIDFVQ